MAAIGAASGGIALLALALPWFAALDLFAYDAWHRLVGARPGPTNTVIVAIDDASLRQFPDTPLAFWQPQLGAAITTLRGAGVRAIGIDLIQASSAESWLKSLGAGDTPAGRNYETPYRAALAGGGVILAAALPAAPGDAEILPPLEHQFLLPGGPDDLGLVNLPGDADGFIRQLAPVLAAEAPNLAFAARLVLAAEGRAPDAAGIAARFGPGGRETRLIPYAGPPQRIPRISLAALVGPDALRQPAVQALRGKVAIIAAEASGLQDFHLTPYARAFPGAPPSLMSGGEVHAQAVEAWLAGREIVRLPPGLSALAAVFLGLAVAWSMRRRSATFAGGLAAALALAALAASLALFRFDLWLPPTPLLLALAGAAGMSLASRAGREARERQRTRKLFARYVSDEVAELAVQGDLADTGGKAAEVSVLFLDIRNFTSLSEKLDSAEVFELLNAWLPRACGPILAGGGNVDKFIGDAVMAVFGAPLAQPDHARRAIDAARAIASAAEDFAGWVAERFPQRDLPPFAIGIGLHAGGVVVGNLGTERRVEYTAIGDTVNVASRLESATKELGWGIVASRALVDAAGPGFKTGQCRQVAVKGKTGMIEVVEILAE